MPVCFQLCPKGYPDKPAHFIAIDEAMCAALGQPCDPEKYLWGWYDTIGLRLALGSSFEKMISEWEDARDGANGSGNAYIDRMIQMAQWLSANYVSDSWREVGRG